MKYQLQKANRNDIRNIFLLCKPWLTDDRFAFYRRYLYRYGKGALKSKQLQSIVEVHKKHLNSISIFAVRAQLPTSFSK